MGTSSGVPTLQRNVSGLVIKRRNSRSWCLVDCGEGTQHQLLRLPYSLVKLSCIFITHVHGDHCYGLPGLLATAAMAGRTEPLTIVGPAGIKTFVLETMRSTDMRMSYELEFIDVAEGHDTKVGQDFIVASCSLSHRVASYAYRFKEIASTAKLNTQKLLDDEIPKGPLWGKIARREDVVLSSDTVSGSCEHENIHINAEDYLLPNEPPQQVIVGGDNDTPELLTNNAPGVNVLIHEATYTQKIADKVGPGPQHSSAKQVAIFAEAVEIGNLVLTHFSARYHHPYQVGDDVIGDIESEASTHYSGRLFLAEDFNHYILDAGILKLIETRGLRRPRSF